jgi:hypothetical protein
MKVLSTVLSASMLLGVGAASASAQGLPPGTMPPVYGSDWAALQLRSQDLKASTSGSRQYETGQAAAPGTTEGMHSSPPSAGGG